MTSAKKIKRLWGETLVRRAISVLFAGLFVVLALGTAPSGARAQSIDTIASIAVEGTQRVEAETVRSYLLVREGDPFDAIRIDRSLKSLFATGLFADVSLLQEGSTLVVRVLEKQY